MRGPSARIEAVTASRTSEAPAWLSALSEARVVAGAPPAVTGIEHDSRRVARGTLFVALPGLTVDGHRFIAEAVQAGAAALIVQDDRQALWQMFAQGSSPAIVAVPDARVALAEAAAGFYGFPARTLGVVGVTGTDGKTTTTHLVAHVLSACGMPCGYLSSVAYAAGGSSELNISHMTTLEAPDVQRQLARVRDAGDRYAAVEASSIGLEMHRVDQCEFDVAVFTNLMQDHLDYHKTMGAYRDAKAILFRMLDGSRDKGLPKSAVVNADDPASKSMLDATKTTSISYGLTAGDLTVSDITTDVGGTRFNMRRAGESVEAFVPLLGAYNAANSAAAVAVAVSQGVPFADAAGALASFPGVPGRMESIVEGQDFRVIVDIASTEQAMRNVLSVLRPATGGRLIVVFGAAGERDPERRTGIARAVAAAADFAVLTNEDPRGEDPEAILTEIAEALRARGFSDSHIERIADRRAAIERAFALARAGDTVLLAGKATEPSIVIGDRHVPWDERAVARELLHGSKSV